MRRFWFGVPWAGFLLCMGLCHPTLAQPKIAWGKVETKDFQLPPSPVIDSNADAVVLGDWGETHFIGNNDGWFSWVFLRKKRMKILQRRGLKHATIRIPLYQHGKRKEEISDISATSYVLEGSSVQSVKLDPKEVFTPKIDQDVSEVSFSIPGAKEGALIEYSYKIQSNMYSYLPSWTFQDEEVPCIWSEYQVVIPMTLIYNYVKQGVHPFYSQTSRVGRQIYSVTKNPSGQSYGEQAENLSVGVNTNEYHWTMKDVPALRFSEKDPYVSNPKNYLDKMEFQLTTINNGDVVEDVANSWKKATQELLEDPTFGRAPDDENGWLQSEVKKILGDEKDPLTNAKIIYYYVSQHFTCTEPYRPYLNTTLYDCWQKKKGSIGDINLLLIAMLQKASILAAPVLTTPKEVGINYAGFPRMDRLRTVICQAKILGNKYFLDATSPKLGFGQLPPNYYNGHARVISSLDTTSFFLDPDSLRSPSVTQVIIINDENGYPSGAFTYTPGYMESYEVRKQLIHMPVEKYLAQYKIGSGLDFQLTNMGIDSLNQLEDPITIHFDFDIREWNKTDQIYFQPLLYSKWYKNPFPEWDRKFPIEMSWPLDEVYNFTMDIPTGYSVQDQPKSTRIFFNGNEGFYEYIIQNTGTSLMVRSRLKLTHTYFPPEDYQTLRKFFADIVEKEHEPIIFKKK